MMGAYLYNQPVPSINAFELFESAGSDPDWLKQIEFNFYSSLMRLRQMRHLPKQQQGKFLKRVKANQQQMKKWAFHAAMNFQHKYELVTAEMARVLGNANQAIAAYDRAILGATEQGYIHEAAIANHRAGEFYLEQGSEKIAQIYLRDAYEEYLNWGAISLAKQLERQYPKIFDRTPNSEILVQKTPSMDGSSSAASPPDIPSIDLNTVIQASQVLSSEIVLEKLLEKFLKMVMENAGATTACLIWHSSEAWAIKARAVLEAHEIIIGEDSPLEASDQLPVALIHHVIQTHEEVILNDAKVEEQFNTDPYIKTHQPKSILSIPILHQGNLMGVLYLENHLTTGVFTSQNIEIIQLLSSQVALSLENAQLYANVSLREQRLRRQSSTLIKLSQRNRQQNSRNFRKTTPLIQDIFGLLTRNQLENETNQTNKTNYSDRSDDLLSSVKEILEASAKTLEIERVSVWLYNEQHTSIKCLDLYELSLKRHTCCMELNVCDYPTYFRVLSTERMITAHDARTDVRTAEFRDHYLISLGITSMLQAPIRVGGQMVGVLCHEHTGLARHWTIEEENFAASLADLVALAIERFYRDKAEQERDRFFSLTQDLLCVMDFQGQFTQLNPAWEKTLAISSEAMLGKSFLQFVHPEDRETTQLAAEKLVSQQEIITFENRYQCADGSYRWLFWNATPDLERQLIYAVVHDITYRVQAEAALKQVNEELEVRVEERTAELQQAIASLQKTNKQLNDEITFRKTTEEALRYSKERLKDQTKELQNALDQLQRTQIQLVQNEKMASLGQLVAGIAHEINNPVSFIYSNIDPLTHYIDDLLHLLQVLPERISPK
jgi:PAS domain S-box-containing protein